MKKIFFLFLFLPLSLPAQEPALTIIHAGAEQGYGLAELIGHSDAVNLSLERDPIYPNHKLTYRAIPLTALFRNIEAADGAIVEFTTEDGYNASLDGKSLLNTDVKLPVAYLAVEDPSHKWPVIDKRQRSAGPLLLIWTNSRLGSTAGGRWPYWVQKIEFKDGSQELYPATLPRSRKYDEGFQVFRQHCFVCHTLNRQGAATLGPDLNYPHNPTEYFRDAYLRKLIRDPSSLRHWPNSKMTPFSKSRLTDAQLNALLEYLKHMSGHKVNRKASE